MSPSPAWWFPVAEPDDSPPWIPLVPADAVGPGTVMAASWGGLDLVVWRTTDGRPCVMEARCPHNWSHLGAEGAVDGDELVCCTHYWRFALDGTGTKLNANGRRDPKADIEVYPCAERDAMVGIITGRGGPDPRG